jgi:hypothetical protein
MLTAQHFWPRKSQIFPKQTILTEKWPIKLQPELEVVSSQLNAWSWII